MGFTYDESASVGYFEAAEIFINHQFNDEEVYCLYIKVCDEVVREFQLFHFLRCGDERENLNFVRIFQLWAHFWGVENSKITPTVFLQIDFFNISSGNSLSSHVGGIFRNSIFSFNSNLSPHRNKNMNIQESKNF